MTEQNTTRVERAEAALATIDDGIAKRLDALYTAQRKFAADPSDETAKVVREAEAAINPWKTGRVAAVELLAEARQAAASEESEALYARAKEHAANATPEAWRARIDPHIAALVACAHQAEAAIAKLQECSRDHNNEVSSAHALCVQADRPGLGVHAVEPGDYGAALFAALSRAGLGIRRPDGYGALGTFFAWTTDPLGLANAVFARLALGEVPMDARVVNAETLARVVDRALAGARTGRELYPELHEETAVAAE